MLDADLSHVCSFYHRPREWQAESTGAAVYHIHVLLFFMPVYYPFNHHPTAPSLAFHVMYYCWWHSSVIINDSGRPLVI